MNGPTDHALAEIVRVEGGRVLAVLARSLGDLQVAEDALQDAVVAALEVWPRTGVPLNASGWLYVAARRKALDVLRRDAQRHDRERRAVTDVLEPEPPAEGILRDDQLRLLFTVCHPALDLDARVALALRVVAGLPTTEVARALLVSEPAMARRLSRAKNKIRRAGIGFRIPAHADLPCRISGACAVIHLVYTAGHAAAGDELVRHDLCDEGVRLARLLVDLLPDQPDPLALLALLLLTDARRVTRLDAAGDPVALPDQARARWDRAAIVEGVDLLDRSLTMTDGVADPYQLQAAIAAVHATASSYETTDWAEAVRLYDILAAVHPNPVVDLNAAVAVAELAGPTAGLERLDGVPEAARSHRWHTARAELLVRLDRPAEATAAFDQALASAPSEPERRHLRRRASAAAAAARR